MMPPDPQQIEEWLSGLLDGVLSEQEQSDLDAAMQNDPSIAERLEEMTKLRSSLLRGRSVGRLGASFSTKVLQAARERASEMDAPPAWILPDAPNAIAPQNQDPQWNEEYSEVDRPFPESIDLLKPSTGARARVNQKVMVQGLMDPGQPATVSLRERVMRVWIPSLAVVLALCALFLLLPRSGQLSQYPSGGLAETQTQQTPDSQTQTQGTTSSNIAESTPKSPTENSSASQQETAVKAPESEGSIAKSPQDRPAMQSKPAPDPLNPAEGKLVMALVANITVDPVAAQNDMLTELLNKYEIISSSDAVLETSEVDTLVSSQILKTASKNPASESDDLTVYVVKASLLRLDSFLQDVERQYADFPNYRLNASVDPTVLKLMDHLVGVSDSPQTAKRLVFKDPETGEATNTIGQPKDPSKNNPEDRKNAKGRRELGQALASQQEGYLILLVRQAK